MCFLCFSLYTECSSHYRRGFTYSDALCVSALIGVIRLLIYIYKIKLFLLLACNDVTFKVFY